MLLMRFIINGKAWLNVIIVAICLAFIASGENAEAFLGTQGYIWDTQSDMALALLGAIISIIVLAKYHDRQLARISVTAAN
jgi:putative membrane protein